MQHTTSRQYRRISNGRPFQMEGPTIEKAWRYLIETGAYTGKAPNKTSSLTKDPVKAPN